MNIYCLTCDNVVPFAELKDHYGAFTCAKCNRYEEYSIRWGDGRGYYVVNFHCEFGSSIGIFIDENLICISCRNTRCDNYLCFDIIKSNLFTAMHRLFEIDEDFNKETWIHTFPARLKSMYVKRKEVIAESLAELRLLPSPIEEIIVNYSASFN